MDSRWSRPRKLIGRVFGSIGAVALIAAAAPLSKAQPSLRAAQWLAPADRVSALGSRPRECLAPSALVDDADAVAIGRVAFRTPVLLGGQAARGGISCASCHSNGRRNAAFFLAGLSGAPGTADVTSALMSTRRDNGVFDPLPIPDLAAPGRISRAPGDGALEAFVRSVIIDEFDGSPPTSATMAGLVAYLRHLRPCAPEEREAITLATATADIESAIGAARAALRRDDQETARLMLAGARWTLGEMDERYPGEELARHRAAIRMADRSLAALQQQLDRDPAAAARALGAWRLKPAILAALRRAEPDSLYAPGVMAAAFGAAAVRP
ncbi:MULTISPECIES: hypothetical protein [unclassified Sphingomonas]|uniref:hypothetical protein n=1 Tax=unclassified Sphingomonas TaxID=196159 RepID=UPI000BC5C8F7|nr:MAG: hypothetical protein B7Z43_05530 [Sphingomonas sp. 12-62-6]OYX37555.1 MAG: hypothetical protein B7Y98_12025 [Sphingomonas sp. 32-62-10]